MEFIVAMLLMMLAILVGLISAAATLIVGVTLANYLGLTGIVWWAFIILFWCVVTSIIGK